MKNPINYSFKTEIIPFIILFLTVVLSFWAYPQLPDTVVSHWDSAGQANGWISRELQSLLLPGMMFGLYLLFSLLPKFDPQSKRYEDFAQAYILIRNAVLLILLVVFTTSTLVNLGYDINIGATVTGAVGLLMVFMGNYFGKIKRNYFIGIRTPWTLSSENVWNKTHRLGGRLFIVWGLCLIITPWLVPQIATSILLGGLVSLISCLMVYSYLLYKKEQAKIKS